MKNYQLFPLILNNKLLKTGKNSKLILYSNRLQKFKKRVPLLLSKPSQLFLLLFYQFVYFFDSEANFISLICFINCS